MRILADENFPRPALAALREAGWDVFSIAEECPGELIFRHGLPAGSGVVLFRITPESPGEAADVALALAESGKELRGSFCVVTRDRIRVRPLHPGSGG